MCGGRVYSITLHSLVKIEQIEHWPIMSNTIFVGCIFQDCFWYQKYATIECKISGWSHNFLVFPVVDVLLQYMTMFWLMFMLWIKRIVVGLHFYFKYRFVVRFQF